MADQDYTLSLKMTAEGGNAAQEAERLADSLERAVRASERLRQVNSGAGPASASPASPAQQQRAVRASASGVLSAVGGVFSAIGRGVSVAFGVLKGAFSGIMSVIRGVASFVRGAFSLAWKGVTTALKTVLGVLGGIAAAGYGAAKLLSPAGEVQRYEVQTGVMLKDPGAGKRRVAELSRYAKETNYSPDEVISAGTQLQAFGMYSMRTLRIAGDVANVFGKRLSEVIQPLAYLKAGRTGEAMESLSRFGVSRQTLAERGIRFRKSGEMVSSNKKALKTVLDYFEQEYSGVTERVGRTWKGTLQQLGGEIFDAMAKGFRGALEPATSYVRDSLIPMITSVGTALARLDWDRVLARPMAILRGVNSALELAATPGMRNVTAQDLKSIVDHFGKVGWSLVEGAGKVIGGILQDLVESFGGIGGIFKAAWDGLAFVLDSFSGGLAHRLGMILDKFPGVDTGETAKEETMRRNLSGRVSSALELLSGTPLQREMGLKSLGALGISQEQIREYEEATAKGFAHAAELQEQIDREIAAMTDPEHIPNDVELARLQQQRDQVLNGVAAHRDSIASQYAEPLVRRHFDQIAVRDVAFPGFQSNGMVHTKENAGKAKAIVGEAMDGLVEASVAPTQHLEAFRRDPGFMGAYDWAVGQGHSRENALQAAREWREIQSAPAVRYREALDRHRQFLREHPGQQDAEWLDFNSRRHQGYLRDTVDPNARQHWMEKWGSPSEGSRRREDEAKRQNEATQQLTQRLDRLNTEIASLRTYISPIVNAYKQEAQA